MPKDKLERYYTADWMMDVFSKNLNYYIGGVILEPFVGKGNISHGIAKNDQRFIGIGNSYNIITNDIDKSVRADHYLDWPDFLANFGDRCDEHETPKDNKPIADWIITNPPFSKAPEFVPSAIKKAKKGVIVLLRLSFLEPCKNRKDFLEHRPPNQIWVTKRCSFDGVGKDQVTTAFMCWINDTAITAHIRNNPINVMNW